MTIPGYIAPFAPVDLEVSATGTPLPAFSGGDVGFLFVEVLDDGSAVYLQPVNAALTPPQAAEWYAALDGTDVRILRSLPLARSGLGAWELISDGGSVDCRVTWAPVAEWGE